MDQQAKVAEKVLQPQRGGARSGLQRHTHQAPQWKGQRVWYEGVSMKLSTMGETQEQRGQEERQIRLKVAGVGVEMAKT